MCDHGGKPFVIRRSTKKGGCGAFHLEGGRVDYSDYPAADASEEMAPGGGDERHSHLFWACPGNLAWCNKLALDAHMAAALGVSKGDMAKIKSDLAHGRMM